MGCVEYVGVVLVNGVNAERENVECDDDDDDDDDDYYVVVVGLVDRVKGYNNVKSNNLINGGKWWKGEGEVGREEGGRGRGLVEVGE